MNIQVNESDVTVVVAYYLDRKNLKQFSGQIHINMQQLTKLYMNSAERETKAILENMKY